jgi:hypothetical protein
VQLSDGRFKGPSINDVTALRGGGINDFVTTALLLKSVPMGGGGVKNYQKQRDVIYVQPLSASFPRKLINMRNLKSQLPKSKLKTYIGLKTMLSLAIIGFSPFYDVNSEKRLLITRVTRTLNCRC